MPRRRASWWRRHPTAAALRAGLPTLILWEVADQFIWATQIKRLKLGSARHLSGVSRKNPRQATPQDSRTRLRCARPRDRSADDEAHSRCHRRGRSA